jgi:branched-chain amino acid transport system permease protein
MAAFSYKLENIVDWRLTIFGLMTLFVVYYLQDGIVGFLQSLIGRGAVHAKAVAASGAEPFPRAQGGKAGDSLLKVDQILMQFGGLKALNQVDLNVIQGSVHGLIGPNGSGKSTMMNVLTGIYKPTAGKVAFAGAVISGRTPSEIALGGVARTFQNVQLFGEMTATENVLVGLHNTFKSNVLDVMLQTPRYKREESRARACRQHPGIRRPVGPGQRGGAQSAVWQAAPAGNRPRAGPESAPAAAGRAGGRPDRARHQGTDGHHPQDPRPRHHHHPDRAPHGRGDGAVRHRDGAGLRPEDRRRQTGVVQSDPKVIEAYLGGGSDETAPAAH